MTDTSPDIVPGGGGQPTRITVRPPGPQQDWEDWTPPEPATRATTDKAPGWDDWTPREGMSGDMSTGEAVFTGLKHGASFGFAPAISGLAEAAGDTGKNIMERSTEAASENPDVADVQGGAWLVQPIIGAARMLGNVFAEHPDEEVKKAYHRGREEALNKERLAQEKHPIAYLSGVLGGAVATPGFGAFAPATTGVRVLRGIRAGGVGGGIFGTGEAVSENADAEEIAKRAAKGGALGAATGGVLGGAIGPRAAPAVPTPGQRATAYADQVLQAPIPRGLASDNAAINATAAKIRSWPVAGSRISSAVDRTQARAGEAVEAISGAAGGQSERAIADALARPALRRVIDNNNREADALYGTARGLIDVNREHPMPRLTAALNRLEYDRLAAGWANPGQGFEQFRRLADRGATFNGAHRARVDARNAGNVLSPNPGYNAADFNRITRAITGDLHELVQNMATNQTPAGRAAALRAFEEAEGRFGQIADQNGVLQSIVDSPGEAAIAKLLTAPKEKGGDLRLLAQLRQTMTPQEFQALGGTLIHDLGFNTASNQFSLAKFATEWAKISDGAKRVMFAPAHLQHLEEIANLGTHIKGALRESNTSHTAGALIVFDAIRDMVMLGVGVGAGAVSAGSVGLGAVAAAPGVLFAHWLASPAATASIGNWTRAYRAVTLGQQTPARIAAFNIATRNLANTLGLPVEQLTRSIANRIGRAEPEPQVENKDDLKK